ncbi:hypothetical protein [Deinococcus knuensis]|uniref:Uncharacterized protein n=1 Tax=Deinococcus knuensis TaxID=1837380 RepID=A0ABQ2T0M1_9DEIO|nr:hypothetical protein [Deinococcus knuensis]GGS43863.1 hypothetical protein GCM10008961_38520 [Deinococcus knuensis]
MNPKTLICALTIPLALLGCRDQAESGPGVRTSQTQQDRQVTYGGNIKRFLALDDVSRVGWLGAPLGTQGWAPGPTDFLLYAAFPFATPLPDAYYPGVTVDEQVITSFAAASIDLNDLIHGRQVDASSLVLTSDVPVLAVQKEGMVFIILLLA